MPVVNLNTLGSNTAPRRAIYRLDASNASLAIPSWAQGGKGFMVVTGCGAGGGGGDNGSNVGGPGATGAMAFGHIIPIASGLTTVGIAIGVAGAAGDPAVNSGIGSTGGATTVTLGSVVVLSLGGGQGGQPGNEGGGDGGVPTVRGTSLQAYQASGTTTTATDVIMRKVLTELSANLAVHSTLALGFSSGINRLFSPGGNTPPATPWGAAGTTASNGWGFGYGGRGASLSGGSAQKSAGGPGFLIVEFVEGL